jgi:hypothetical protein
MIAPFQPSDQQSRVETTPLLSSQSPLNATQPTLPTESTPAKPSPFLITTLVILWVLIIEFGDELVGPAQTRVFESIYCQLYYEKHDSSLIGSDGRGGVAEKWCKIPIVQGQVAMLKGWQITLNGVGSELGLCLSLSQELYRSSGSIIEKR